eukprot:scaffold185313_cov41-Attheya_sp.AAC.1
MAGGIMKARVPCATPPTRFATAPKPPIWARPKHALTATATMAARAAAESSDCAASGPNMAFSKICRPLENTMGNVKMRSTHKRILSADR